MPTSATTVHLNVADGFWNTCEYAGTTTTFRVLTPEDGEPVEVHAFLNALAARIARLDASLKEVTSDFSGADATAAERDGDVRLAAESVYKSLEVEVSLLDDPAAVPEDPSCDAAVDLWLPMHLAVVVQHEDAIKALLAFHHNHALTVLQQLAGETLGVEECLPATGAGLAASPSLNATHTSSALASAAATTSGIGGASVSAGDDDMLASGEQTPSNKPTNGQEVGPTLSSASPEDTRLNPTDARAEAFPLHQRPVVELQIRPDLGNTLVLLGHYTATASSVAFATAPATSSTRTTKPTASPLRRSSLSSATGASHASDLSSQSHHPRSHSHVDPAAAAAAAPAGEPEDGVLEWLHLNAQQMELEEALFQDAGDELCVENVLGMLKSLVRFAVAVAEEEEGVTGPAHRAPRAFTVGDLVDPEVLGHLYVSSTVLFDACKGDLQRLESVFTAFQGSLTPVIRGKSLPYSISGKSFVQQRNSVGGGGALSDTPTMRPISRTSSGPLSQMVSTPRGRPSGGGGGVALAPLALPSGLHVSSTPFWVNCAPQDSLRLAFVGLWVALREQYTEGLGSARGHRHVSIRQDYRMAIAGLKKARLPNLASCRSSGGGAHMTAMATVVPTASSIVSSGQLFLISRLLSSECRVEEFLDLTEDATFFNSLAPASFTGAMASSSTNATSSTSASNNSNQNGFCGTLPLVLAASAFVASELRAPGQVRLTATKIETLLSDTRTNTLRAYVCGHPATHAERFEELWLGASQDTSPKKFKTRAEMLFYSTIEQVLLGAERTWAEEKAAAAAAAAAAASAHAKGTSHAHDHLAAMAKGLQSWIVMWRNFLISVRDRPVLPGAVHRRSISSVSRTSATATPKMQPMAPPPMTPPPAFDVSSSMATTALAPDPVAAVTAAATEEDETGEATETFQRLLDVLPLRLQHGEPPLPEVGAQIYPPSAPAAEDASTVTELPQTTLDSEFEYSQNAFGEMAGSEANDVKLKFYGLFKQATVGDINISKPWLMDQVGRAKWEAWNKLKGMNVMDAKRMYVSEFKLLKHMRAAQSGAGGVK